MKKSFAEIAKEYHLKLIVLFGSRAGKIHRKESDADIAIVTTKPITLKKELLLRKDLFYALGHEIDLVILPSREATPLLLGQIAKEAQCLYGKRSDFITFKVNSMQRFIDFKPYFELQAKTIKKALA